MLNPFTWYRPLETPNEVVGMDGFAREVALALTSRANIAIFGARGTGKSSFLTRLTAELETSHGKKAPPVKVIQINLETALSIPAFIACIHDAMVEHPDRRIRSRAKLQIRELEREVGFNLKVISGSLRTRERTLQSEQLEILLHAQLRAVSKLADKIVVLFDEFQRLRHCAGEPLGVIRSALLTTHTPHVSILVTGSMRDGLQMMLRDSRKPIFGQTTEKQLPRIPEDEFIEYLESRYNESGMDIQPLAAERIVSLCEAHPKRTQQLAAMVWDAHRRSKPITVDNVDDAYTNLLEHEAPDFRDIYAQLVEGGDPEVNEARALFVLAEAQSRGLTSRVTSEQWGFRHHNALGDAAQRLRRRGLVDRNEHGYFVIDPLLRDWLQANNPF